MMLKWGLKDNHTCGLWLQQPNNATYGIRFQKRKLSLGVGYRHKSLLHNLISRPVLHQK